MSEDITTIEVVSDDEEVAVEESAAEVAEIAVVTDCSDGEDETADEEDGASDEGLKSPSAMDLIKTIAARASLGHTDKMPLVVGGMKIDNENFYIQFKEAPSDAVDAWMDAMNQFESVENMEVDDETGLVVGEQKTKRHSRAWPLLDVLLDYRIILDAQLPFFDKHGELKAFKWSSAPQKNRDFMRRAKQATISMVLSMAGDHIIGGESTGVMSQLGE